MDFEGFFEGLRWCDKEETSGHDCPSITGMISSFRGANEDEIIGNHCRTANCNSVICRLVSCVVCRALCVVRSVSYVVCRTLLPPSNCVVEIGRQELFYEIYNLIVELLLINMK